MYVQFYGSHTLKPITKKVSFEIVCYYEYKTCIIYRHFREVVSIVFREYETWSLLLS
jgi:hypothetical protein